MTRRLCIWRPRDRDSKDFWKSTCWHLPITAPNFTSAAAAIRYGRWNSRKSISRIAPTLRAFQQTYAIALEAGETDTATELSAKATKRWGNSLAFQFSPFAKGLIGNRKRSSRMIVDRRVFVAGAAVAAFSPALPLLASDVAVPELRAVQPPVFMISGWSAEGDSSTGDEIWMRVGHGWRTAWR